MKGIKCDLLVALAGLWHVGVLGERSRALLGWGFEGLRFCGFEVLDICVGLAVLRFWCFVVLGFRSSEVFRF